MNELRLGQTDRAGWKLRPLPFWATLIVVLVVAFAFAQWGLELFRTEGNRTAVQSNVAPASEARMMAGKAAQAQPEEDAFGWRVLMAAVYIGILGSGAVAVRYRQKLLHLPQAVSAKDGETIVVRQSKRVNAQLTLVVVEVDGRKLLVAASPRAISTTILEDR